jgi:hypothetical protein
MPHAFASPSLRLEVVDRFCTRSMQWMHRKEMTKWTQSAAGLRARGNATADT